MKVLMDDELREDQKKLLSLFKNHSMSIPKAARIAQDKFELTFTVAYARLRVLRDEYLRKCGTKKCSAGQLIEVYELKDETIFNGGED